MSTTLDLRRPSTKRFQQAKHMCLSSTYDLRRPSTQLKAKQRKQAFDVTHFDVKKDIRIVHKSPGMLGISLCQKKNGGTFIRAAPKHQASIVRRGMTLISINRLDVSTFSLQQVVLLLKQRPLSLVFRPAPSGSAVLVPDPNAPPPRPTIPDRVSAAKYFYRQQKKLALKKQHLQHIQKYRIGPPKSGAGSKEVQMCAYRNTVTERRQHQKRKLKNEFFREQWERRSAGYRRTLAMVFDAMDVDGDGTLTRHEIFKSIVLDATVQSLLALSPNVERLLSPWIFHKSWNDLDSSNDGEVDRAEFVQFAMTAESQQSPEMAEIPDELEGSTHAAERADTEQCRQRPIETPNSPVDLDLSLLKLYRDLKRVAGGVKPSSAQVALFLSNPNHRRMVERTHMRHHKTTFGRMTARIFLQYVVGKDKTEPIPEQQEEEQKEHSAGGSIGLKEFLIYGWYMAETTSLQEMMVQLEVRALRTVFVQLDRNGDGSLTKREIKRAIVSDAAELAVTLQAFPEMAQGKYFFAAAL